MAGLSHWQAQQYLQQSADGRLAASANAELQSHLQACPECRAYAAELEALEAALVRALHARWDQRRAPRARPCHH